MHCPRRPGLPLERWLVTFPSFGFLLVGDADAVIGRARAAGLAAPAWAPWTRPGACAWRAAAGEELFWDLAVEPLTGLGAA